MKVKELIALLNQMPLDVDVFYSYLDINSGCDTCGEGADTLEGDINQVLNFDTKVILDSK